MWPQKIKVQRDRPSCMFATLKCSKRIKNFSFNLGPASLLVRLTLRAILMTGNGQWGPMMLSLTGKLGSCFFCFPWSESLHRPYCAAVKRLLCQILPKVTFAWPECVWPPRNKKWLHCQFQKSQKKRRFSLLCTPVAAQAQCSCFIILSPISVQK